MKHKTQQFEIGFADEPFALVAEKAPDFEQIQAEARRREFDQVQAEAQADLFGPPKLKNGAFDIPCYVEVRDGVPEEIRKAMEATGLCDHDKPKHLCPFCN